MSLNQFLARSGDEQQCDAATQLAKLMHIPNLKASADLLKPAYLLLCHRKNTHSQPGFGIKMIIYRSK